MSQKIYLKTVIKDTSENWSKFSGILPNGVIAYESDTNKMKLGDGITKINDLPHMIGDSASATIYKFKGSVASKKNLPSTAENGDVYNVEDTGSNYAFTGSSWDKLSENIDLSPYLTKESAISTYSTIESLNETNEKVSNIEAQVLLKADASVVEEELEEKAYKSETNALTERIKLLEDKVIDLTLSSSSKEEAIVTDGKITVPSGSTDIKVVNATMTKASALTAKTISVKDLKVDSTSSTLSKLTLEGSDLTINNSTFTGEFSKLGSNNKATGTNVIQVQVPEEETTLVIKNVTIDTPLAYNGLLTNNANLKSVLIDNVKMLGRFDNNAITISGTADNAVVTISNCEFDKISNLLRISNISNSTGVVINLINCSINQWEQNEPQWRGMICCQDYTSESVEDEKTNNLFASEKITINISNCSLNGKNLTESDKEDLIYVYRSKEAKAGGKGTYRLSDDSSIFPKININ